MCELFPEEVEYVGVYNHEFTENNVTAAKNYCRHVDGWGPWCYTTNTGLKKQECLIPKAGGAGFRNL